MSQARRSPGNPRGHGSTSRTIVTDSAASPARRGVPNIPAAAGTNPRTEEEE